MNLGLFDQPSPDRPSQSSKVVVRPPRYRWGTRILLPVLLLLFTGTLLIGAAWRSLFPGIAVEVIPVMVKTVEGEVGGESVIATGWLEPDPYPFFASALVNGTVAEVTVLEGQTVKKGEVVARLIKEDAQLVLNSAEADLSIAQGDLARAQAAVAAAEERLSTRIELHRAARTTDALLADSEAEVSRLEPLIASQEAKVAEIADELSRKEQVVESGAVSEGSVQRLRLSLAAKTAELEALLAQRPQLLARANRARANRDAAAENLKLSIDERLEVALTKADLTRAEGALDRAKAHRDEALLALDRKEIRAPIDGIVMQRLISPGSPIKVEGQIHSAHVAHIYDPEHLQVRVDVPLADAAAVGVDQRAEIRVSALPDQVFRGQVTRLVHEADLQKNTVEVKVAIEKPNSLLKPEMLARVRFLASSVVQSSRERILVPQELIETDEDNGFIWIVADRVDGQGYAERREITLGSTRVEGWREVISGLQPGDWLIADSPEDLKAGEAVTISGEGQR